MLELERRFNGSLAGIEVVCRICIDGDIDREDVDRIVASIDFLMRRDAALRFS